MSSKNNAASRLNKNCLVAFRNKKLNNFDGENSLINAASALGYYFDKISYVAYDSPEEIVRSLIDGRQNYENMFIHCPVGMESMLKNFVKSLYSAEFSELGILKSDEGCVFMIFSDTENRLRYDDIKNIRDARYGIKYEKAYIKTVGASAAEINAALQKALEEDGESIKKDINVNISDTFGDCSLEIVYSDKLPKSMFDKVYRTLCTSLNEHVYAIENVSLTEQLFRLLKLRRMKISVAESFTGGGIGKRLVDVSGISEVYFEGLNTYANEAKIKRLNVNELTLRHYGAVSEEVAHEMTEGLLGGGDCDLAIATTGIAGPKSDNTAKPVGLCYIAVGTKENISVYEYYLKGSREAVTNTAINLALFLAYKTIK